MCHIRHLVQKEWRYAGHIILWQRLASFAGKRHWRAIKAFLHSFGNCKSLLVEYHSLLLQLHFGRIPKHQINYESVWLAQLRSPANPSQFAIRTGHHGTVAEEAEPVGALFWKQSWKWMRLWVRSGRMSCSRLRWGDRILNPIAIRAITKENYSGSNTVPMDILGIYILQPREKGRI